MLGLRSDDCYEWCLSHLSQRWCTWIVLAKGDDKNIQSPKSICNQLLVQRPRWKYSAEFSKLVHIQIYSCQSQCRRCPIFIENTSWSSRSVFKSGTESFRKYSQIVHHKSWANKRMIIGWFCRVLGELISLVSAVLEFLSKSQCYLNNHFILTLGLFVLIWIHFSW